MSEASLVLYVLLFTRCNIYIAIMYFSMICCWASCLAERTQFTILYDIEWNLRCMYLSTVQIFEQPSTMKQKLIFLSVFSPHFIFGWKIIHPTFRFFIFRPYLLWKGNHSTTRFFTWNFPISRNDTWNVQCVKWGAKKWREINWTKLEKINWTTHSELLGNAVETGYISWIRFSLNKKLVEKSQIGEKVALFM